MIRAFFSTEIDLNDHSESKPIWGYVEAEGQSVQVWIRGTTGHWFKVPMRKVKVVWVESGFELEWRGFRLSPICDS